METHVDCQLCAEPGGDLLWEDDSCRVVSVADDDGRAFPGFCRVIWRQHVAEMSDLGADDALRLMHVVLATERAVRQVLRPEKINLASLGNMVPHLHWHVIPRWANDSHFPAPIWAAARRIATPRLAPARTELLRALEAELSTLTPSP